MEHVPSVISVGRFLQFLFNGLKINIVYINTGRNNITNACSCTAYEQAVTGMIAPNPYLFHNLVWEYPFIYAFLFTPTFSGKQQGRRVQRCSVT
jgi:hypothetical protein